MASAIVSACGGDSLKHCLTCDECVSLCFIEHLYPGVTPREITRGVLEGRIQELVDSDFLWACTLCGKCTMDCPKGLHMDSIIRKLRGISLRQGKAPKRLQEGLDKIKEIGNSVGIDEEEFVDSLQWLGEEAAEEMEGVDEDEFSVPVDKEGVEFLYIPNPREYTSAPNMFSVYLGFFLAVKADWTFASNLRDISNWAYYMGDEETHLMLVRNIVDTARRLGVKAIVTTECGHGFKIIRKDAEGLIGEPLGFEVISIVELAYRYFKEGRLRLRQGAVEESVTYDDPCNVGRKLGIYDEPRELLKYIAKEYLEMTPARRDGICCGGGGGVAQNTDMGQKRLEFGRAKRDQILASGAKIVTTSCQMCLAQLNDIQIHYELPVKTRTVMELVMESLAD
jgi:Fe-S oxidoreductase